MGFIATLPSGGYYLDSKQPKDVFAVGSGLISTGR